MQRARHGFISGEHDVSEAHECGREALALSAVQCIVLITVARGAWEGGTREGESGFGDER